MIIRGSRSESYNWSHEPQAEGRGFQAKLRNYTEGPDRIQARLCLRNLTDRAVVIGNFPDDAASTWISVVSEEISSYRFRCLRYEG